MSDFFYSVINMICFYINRNFYVILLLIIHSNVFFYSEFFYNEFNDSNTQGKFVNIDFAIFVSGCLSQI